MLSLTLVILAILSIASTSPLPLDGTQSQFAGLSSLANNFDPSLIRDPTALPSGVTATGIPLPPHSDLAIASAARTLRALNKMFNSLNGLVVTFSSTGSNLSSQQFNMKLQKVDKRLQTLLRSVVSANSGALKSLANDSTELGGRALSFARQLQAIGDQTTALTRVLPTKTDLTSLLPRLMALQGASQTFFERIAPHAGTLQSTVIDAWASANSVLSTCIAQIKLVQP
ncbi:hypothetical protein MIND_01254600 [Mycena indigotica]|uniref:Uncharacterized protein n=1 Tax=Mycena indigotica TaxID=2126181 RepID=A0A8H6S4E8_9AGAR|nr:uncharacterized protein MIND_01254600 [Mycena indigotica]KAF7291115.1 hypothetical protein MIND_01254600 [Mycena indigotica]